MLDENKFYSISKLDENTYLVIDKTNYFSNHYYKSFSGASKKLKSIMNNRGLK